VTQTVNVCVPRGAPAEVAIRARGASPIGGDQRTLETFALPRGGGVLVGSIALGEPGATCVPSP
jgi:hypothetical protein